MLDFERSHTDRKVFLPLLFSLMKREEKKSRLLSKFLKAKSGDPGLLIEVGHAEWIFPSLSFFLDEKRTKKIKAVE
jgi:hypothetical protein